MKKFISLICALFIPIAAHCAESYNPMFGAEHRNALSLHVAQGTGNGSLTKLINPFEWEFSSMTSVMLQYSQPMEIMRLPARMNVTYVQNIAYGHDTHLGFWGVGLSWDVALINWCGYYLGGGIGPYMRDAGDDYVSSRLVFGEKVFIGIPVADNMRVEFFTMHFSNGDFTDVNLGFNFTGLSFHYSF